MMTTSRLTESRRYKRVPLGARLECRSQEGTTVGWAENVCVAGMLVRAASTFAPDAVISVSFPLPDSDVPIRCQARVAHVVPGAFMGIEFLDLSPADRQRIEEFAAATAAAKQQT